MNATLNMYNHLVTVNLPIVNEKLDIFRKQTET